jgi:CRP-like cAMP-binding protein
MDIRQAIDESFLSGLPGPVSSECVRDATLAYVPAGVTFIQEGDVDRLSIIISGLARAFLSSEDGRELTIRTARRGAAVGALPLTSHSSPMSVRAITDCRVLELSVERLHFGDGSARLGWAVAGELGRRLLDAYEGLRDQTFASAKQRLARRLIDAAIRPGRGQRAVVTATQQELGDSIGSSRETVSRALSQMRRDGLVILSRGTITLIDHASLNLAATSAGVDLSSIRPL